METLGFIFRVLLVLLAGYLPVGKLAAQSIQTQDYGTLQLAQIGYIGDALPTWSEFTESRVIDGKSLSVKLVDLRDFHSGVTGTVLIDSRSAFYGSYLDVVGLQYNSSAASFEQVDTAEASITPITVAGVVTRMASAQYYKHAGIDALLIVFPMQSRAVELSLDFYPDHNDVLSGNPVAYPIPGLGIDGWRSGYFRMMIESQLRAEQAFALAGVGQAASTYERRQLMLDGVFTAISIGRNLNALEWANNPDQIVGNWISTLGWADQELTNSLLDDLHGEIGVPAYITEPLKALVNIAPDVYKKNYVGLGIELTNQVSNAANAYILVDRIGDVYRMINSAQIAKILLYHKYVSGMELDEIYEVYGLDADTNGFSDLAREVSGNEDLIDIPFDLDDIEPLRVADIWAYWTNHEQAWMAGRALAGNLFPDVDGDQMENADDPDSNAVTASAASNAPPVAHIATTATTVNLHTLVSLNGGGSLDPDGDTLTGSHAWVLTRPTGSNAVLSSGTGTSTSFTADKEGTYNVRLSVSDGQLSGTKSIQITAVGSYPNVEVEYNDDVAHLYITGISFSSTNCQLKSLPSVTVPAGEKWKSIKFAASQGDVVLLVDDDETPSLSGTGCQSGLAQGFDADAKYDWFNGSAIFDWGTALQPGTVLRLAAFSYEGSVSNFAINSRVRVTTDLDGDGVPDANEDAVCRNNSADAFDSDGDGVCNSQDKFPNDPAASQDSDGDGYPNVWNNGKSQVHSTTGLVLDAFANTSTEWADSDADGIGNNADKFANDPAASQDSDNDGAPDTWNAGKSQADSSTGLHLDKFPLDPAASLDSDGDGYPEYWNPGKSAAASTSVPPLSIDMFPGDPTEWQDTDLDGRGDNTDQFPDDPFEWQDSDGDTVGDNADAAPHDSSRHANVAPTISAIADLTLAAGTTSQVDVSASDADGDAINYRLVVGPVFASVAESAVILAPLNLHVGTYTIALEAFDGFGGRSLAQFQVIVQLPSSILLDISSPAPATSVPYSQSSVQVSGSATNPSGQVISLEFRKGDGAWTAGTLNGADWTFSVALDVGSNPIEVRAKDENGAYAYASIAIGRMAPPNAAPQLVVATTDATIAAEQTSFAVNGTASDDVAVTSVEYRINAGSWQPASGSTNWAFIAFGLQAGFNAIEVRAVDGAGAHSATKSILVSRALTAMNAGSGDTLGDGLLAHYSFSGNANDSTANGKHGVINGAVLTTDRAGNPGAAYQFDGINDSIELPIDSSTLTPAFTLSIWVYQTKSFTENSKMGAISSDRTSPRGVFLGLQSNSVSGFKVMGSAEGSGPLVPASTWTLLSMTYDETGLLKNYVNGALVSSTQGNGTVSGGKLIIGRDPYGNESSRYWGGKLDEARIYSRALTPDEVQSLFSGGEAPEPSETNVKPILQVTSAAGGSTVYAPHTSVSVIGTAADEDGSVSAIYYRVNNGAVVQGAGASSWSLTAELVPGTNQIEVWAVDDKNESSTIAALTVTRSSQPPPAPPARAWNDYNGDGRSDVLWRNEATGKNTIWLGADSSTAQYVSPFSADWIVGGTGDFDGDGQYDLLLRNWRTGQNLLWRSASRVSGYQFLNGVNLDWDIAGIADFDGDGTDDVLWRNRFNGRNTIYKAAQPNQIAVATVADLNTKVAGLGDFDSDGRADILWRHAATGANTIWFAANHSNSVALAAVTDFNFRVVGIDDFNGDGDDDILWRNAVTGVNAIWLSGDATAVLPVAKVLGDAWRIVGTGDYNGDGRADIFWRHEGLGINTIWLAADKNQPNNSMRKIWGSDYKVLNRFGQ